MTRQGWAVEKVKGQIIVRHEAPLPEAMTRLVMHHWMWMLADEGEERRCM